MSDTLAKAKLRLVLDRPFWATLALRRAYSPDAQHGTMETNGKDIRYDEGFVDRHTVAEIEGVIAHELYHIVAKHHLRRGKRDPDRWNRACDYVINQDLIDDGFKLPADRLLNRKFKGMSAEEVYRILEEEEQDGAPQPGEGEGAPDWGVVLDGDPETEQELTSELLTAVKAGKMAGKVPGFMEELAQLSIRRKTDWKKILRRFVSKGMLRKRSIRRPNRRYISQDIYLPGKIKHGIPRLNMIVDVSGSINREMFELFLGELEFIRRDLRVNEVRIMTIDTRIISDKVFQEGQKLDVKLKGRGGTNLDQAFEALKDNAPTIVFTDGEFRDPAKAPSNPVLWVIPGSTRPRSFGEVVEIVE